MASNTIICHVVGDEHFDVRVDEDERYYVWIDTKTCLVFRHFDAFRTFVRTVVEAESRPVADDEEVQS